MKRKLPVKFGDDKLEFIEQMARYAPASALASRRQGEFLSPAHAGRPDS